MVSDCFQFVSNGKALIASAITDKGIATSSDATFETMANNILNIINDLKTNTNYIIENGEVTDIFSLDRSVRSNTQPCSTSYYDGVLKFTGPGNDINQNSFTQFKTSIDVEGYTKLTIEARQSTDDKNTWIAFNNDTSISSYLDPETRFENRVFNFFSTENFTKQTIDIPTGFTTIYLYLYLFNNRYIEIKNIYLE